MSDSPTLPVRLGVLPPAALTSGPTPASSLPWTPPRGATIPETSYPSAPQAQADGVNGPVPLPTIPRPEPAPRGGPRPVPFHLEAG